MILLSMKSQVQCVTFSVCHACTASVCHDVTQLLHPLPLLKPLQSQSMPAGHSVFRGWNTSFSHRVQLFPL